MYLLVFAQHILVGGWREPWEPRRLAAFLVSLALLMTCGCSDDKPTQSDPPSTPGTVTDFDGNVYHTVTIGAQVWMVENLKVTHYRNGDPIDKVTDGASWYAATSGAYCDYTNDAGLAATYGRLYNGSAVDDSRKIAPTGWHVATAAEWQTLITTLGGDAGGKLKEIGTSHWNSPNTGATNATGFKALPGGYRDESGDFYHLGDYACFWTPTLCWESDPTYRVREQLTSTTSTVDAYCPGWGVGASVRCIRD